MMSMLLRRLRRRRLLWHLCLRHWSTHCGSPLHPILRSTFPPSANPYIPRAKHRMDPLPATLMLRDSTRKVMPGHPKNMRTRCIWITSLTDSMSAQLVNPSNVCGAPFRVCAVIDHFPDVTTCIGTNSAGFPCRFLQMTYPNGYSPCLQRVLLPQPSQRLLSMSRTHPRGVYSMQHLFLPVHNAGLAAYSNISSCQI